MAYRNSGAKPSVQKRLAASNDNAPREISTNITLANLLLNLR